MQVAGSPRHCCDRRCSSTWRSEPPGYPEHLLAVCLAVCLQRRICEVRRRRRAGHVRLFHKIGLGIRRALRVQPRAVNSKGARPLRADQHVILPDAVRRQQAMEHSVHVLGRVGQRRLANDLAFVRVVSSEPELEGGAGVPRSGRCRVHSRTVALAPGVEKIVGTMEVVRGDLFLIRHVLHVLECRPDPLRTTRGLMHRMKADQAQGFRQARPRCVRPVRVRGIRTRASTMWKILASFSVSDRIFHDTFSMKAPSVPGWAGLPAWAG
jgi:hypothetical protein